jgi:hypothetical protein
MATKKKLAQIRVYETDRNALVAQAAQKRKTIADIVHALRQE